MCGFGVSSKVGLTGVNQFCQRRGPDLTNSTVIHGVEFLHNLLHITGDVVPQPFVKDNVVCVFNGEIYNYKTFGEYASDGECILDLYKKFGPDFVKKLDGEFAICLVDFKNRIILISTDTFACKPLWYEIQPGQFCVASYNSQLQGLGFNQGQKLTANTTRVYDQRYGNIILEYANVTWDLNQHKTDFTGWITAFKNSIRKRTANTKQGMFVGMSSGYDSGAIACELHRQQVEFKAYSIINNENMKVVAKRAKILGCVDQFELSRKEYQHWHQELNNCEDFSYNDHLKKYNIKTDQASMGLASICSRANKEKRRIYFSGQGADEIISDYGHNGVKFFKHSSFGGQFPDRLEGFFPWHSFYNGTQVQYLNKEEYVAGHFGIETRYPFLDRDLVQEFLWLIPELKNSKYKSALAEYLEVNNFPYSPNEKLGFHVTDKK